MTRYLLIPGEILSARGFSPLEKMLLSFIYNTTKDGKECYASTEWLSVLFGTKEEIIENFVENLVKNGIINSYAGRKSLAVSLEFIKNYSKQNVKIPEGILTKGESWQKSKITSANSVANLVATYLPETKAEAM